MTREPLPIPSRKLSVESSLRTARAALRELGEGGLSGVTIKVAGRARRRAQLARYQWNPRSLLRSPSGVPIDRPVFILGVQGGGITVLARCLYRHTRVVYASGNWRWWAGEDEIHNCGHVESDLPSSMIHRSFHFGNVDASVEDHPLFGLQRAWLYAIDEMLPAYQRTSADADEASSAQFRRVIQKIALAYADDPDHCRFVDMSQLYTIQVPYIARMLEDCDPRFILVSRNPYATCARAVSKEYVRERGGYIEADEELRIRCAVEHWSNSYRLALEASHTVPMLRLRYEDFLENPERTIRNICDFTGLPFEQRQVPAAGQAIPFGSLSPDKWYPLRPAENDRYLDSMPKDVIRLLNQRAAGIIEELGYERLV